MVKSFLRVKDCRRLFKVLVDRSVKFGSCGRSKGLVHSVKRYVSFGRSKSGSDKLLESSRRQVRQSILIS